LFAVQNGALLSQWSKKIEVWMRLPLILTLIACTLLGACSGVAVPDAPEATATEAPAKIETPWALTIGAQRDAGAEIQSDGFGGETETLEAAGRWLVVMLNVENASKQRQSAKDVFSLSSAKLVDGAGKTYDVDTDAVSILDDTLDKKPFEPGEARTIKLVFDVPKDAKPKQVTIWGDDVKGDVQDFIAKF
jgi:Domain of unknown function (DUF4352)